MDERIQYDLFEEEKIVEKINLDQPPVEVSTLIPEVQVKKNKYFIYPTNGKHPFAAFDKKLDTNDYPYVEDRNYHNRGTKSSTAITIRDKVAYPVVSLAKETIVIGRSRTISMCIHKLVARAFLKADNIDPYDKYTVVDHIDGKPWDYRLTNLRFVTRSQNNKGCKKASKQRIFEVGKLNKRY